MNRKIHLGNPKTGRAWCGGRFGVSCYDTEDPNKASCRRCKMIEYAKRCHCMVEPDGQGAEHVAVHSSDCPDFLGY